MKLHKGDTVQMMVGKDAGKQAKIVRVRPDETKVLLEGLNMAKRHKKPRKQGQKGEIVNMPRFVPAANVMIVCPACNKPARVGYTMVGNKKVRVCKKCAAEMHTFI